MQAVSTKDRLWTRDYVVVCVVMAILFGLLHVRNFPGAFISAICYGLVFICRETSGIAWHSMQEATSRLRSLQYTADCSWETCR